MNDAVQLITDVWGSTSGNFRGFHDSIRDPKLAKKWEGDFNELMFDLFAKNQEGYGIYFVVNHGGNTDDTITHTSAIMIDIDNNKGLPDSWHVQPHIITRKGATNNYHVYWLINTTEDLQEWARTCKRLIQFYGSDPRIFNPSRVMRLPDFMHLKDPNNPDTYSIIYRSEAPRYDLSQVAQGLPEVSYAPEFNKRGGVLVESDDIYALERGVRFLEDKAEPAIEGQGGNTVTFAAFAYLRDLGLSKTKSMELVVEYYNPRCEPEWSEDELQIIADNAYRYAAGEQGSKNVLSSFITSGFFEGSTPEQTAPVVPSAPVTADTQPPAAPRTDIVSGIDPYDITVGCGYSKNHTENASRFIAENYPGDTLRFHNDTWYIFSGKHWYNPDMSSQPGTAIKRGVTIAMLNATPSNSDINGTVGVIEKICSRPKDLGAFGNRTDVGSLLLVENGILNVSTGQLEPHNPDFFSTNLLPFAYSPDAQCPTWDRFLADVTEGDRERIQFIEEWLGYMMVRDYSFQKIAMFIGVQRSGKTTIANIAKRLVGANNYAGLGLEGFAQDGTLESALDKTVLWVGDAGTISGPQRSTIVDRLKTISGNGDLSVGRKYKSAFNGRMPGRIAITCNNVLQFSDDSGALAGRFIICPFNKSFFGQEDPQLENKLAAELPGIANRCIKALQRLRSRGHFVEPSIASSDRDSITSRYSPILSFLTDECVVGPEERVHNQNLYARYKMWVARNGHKALAYNNFVDAVRTATRGKTTKGPTMIEGIQLQGFRGISLKPDEQPENVSAFPQHGVC